LIHIALLLGVFWTMQTVAQLLFKWGSLSDSRWLTGFLFGNLFGFSSIWLMMLVYKVINPNIALGLATAGSFLLGQLAISAVFETALASLQWFGMVVIVTGVMLLAAGGDLQSG